MNGVDADPLIWSFVKRTPTISVAAHSQLRLEVVALG
jgi:hypothetical protein